MPRYLHQNERLDKLASVPRKVGGRNGQFCVCASSVRGFTLSQTVPVPGGHGSLYVSRVGRSSADPVPAPGCTNQNVQRQPCIRNRVCVRAHSASTVRGGGAKCLSVTQ